MGKPSPVNGHGPGGEWRPARVHALRRRGDRSAVGGDVARTVIGVAPELEPLMTKQELAKYLRVGTRTIDNYAARGMPFVPLRERGRRYRLSDVLRWLEDG